MQAFWTAINQNNVTVTPVPQDPAIVAIPHLKLRLPLGITWGESPDEEILVRECYTNTAPLLINPANKYALLSGTSNIGKSVFIYYLIYAIIRHHVENAVTGAPRPTFVIKTPDGIFYHLHAINGVPTAEKFAGQIIDHDVDYFISDTLSQPSYPARKLHLHVTSVANEDHGANRDAIVHKKRGRALLFEPFSFNEYVLCCGVFENNAYTNREELQYRYDLFGGAIGLLLEVDQNNADKVEDCLLELVNNEIHRFYEGAFTAKNTPITDEYRAMFERCAVVFASHLMTVQMKSKTLAIIERYLRSLFVHIYCATPGSIGTIKVFSSKFAEYLLATIVKEKTENLWDNIERLFGRSGAGFAFEKIGHEEILRLMQSPEERMLCTLVKKNNKNPEIQKSFGIDHTDFIAPLRKRCIRTWDDLIDLQPNEYAFPVVSNFKLIDSAVKLADGTTIVFQFTRSVDHTSHFTEEQYTNWSDILDEVNQILYVHVVPADVYDEYKGDGNLPEKEYVQYKYRSKELTPLSEVGRKRKLEELP